MIGTGNFSWHCSLGGFCIRLPLFIKGREGYDMTKSIHLLNFLISNKTKLNLTQLLLIIYKLGYSKDG